MAREVDYASGSYGKQKSGSKCSRLCGSIYNREKGEFFGRNCASWAKLGAFYTIYYSCLAGFFAAMMFGFFQTLDDTKPTMVGMMCPMKQNPGMGFRPQMNRETALIRFNSKDVNTYVDKVEDILSYLRENGYINEKYETSEVTKDSNGKDVFSIEESLSPGCSIDHTNLNNSFGYADGKPCVLLKINNVFDWMPQAFDNDSLSTDHGKDAQAALGDDWIKQYGDKNVGVSCEGENDGDLDNMGEVVYFPTSGFSFKYFPYVNAKNYRAPIVFAKFNGVKMGSLLQIWCKIWTKGTFHHKNDRAASARFELLVDDRI